MKRMQLPNLVLAATLALMLPLEQAHCAWMGLQRHAAPVTSTAANEHACCKPHAAAAQHQQAQPENQPRACLCEQLPTGTLPPGMLLGGEAPSVTALAEFTIPASSAPVSVVLETVMAPDVGSPPLPHHPRAHGLRAPPVGA